MNTEQMEEAFEAWKRRPCKSGQTVPELLGPDLFKIAAKGWTDGWKDALATQPQAPQGWKLVPIEPTNEMLMAVSGEWHHSLLGTARERYAAMLKIAPTETPEGAKP